MAQSLSVHELKQLARRKIICSPIQDDQATTLNRWVETFINDEGNDQINTQIHQNACHIMQFVIAAIAKGDFQIKTQLRGSFHAPGHQLRLTDYISHASRVLLDLSELSEQKKQQLAPLFEVGQFKLEKRTSTHYLTFEEGRFHEKKSKANGLMQGALGVLDWVGDKTGINNLVEGTRLQGPDLKNFGINIQMGGFNQKNLSGGFSQFGLDGHVFIYRELHSLLIGLEQSAPSQKPGTNPDDIESNQLVGLSGTHSMLGNSDDYTAAGSLYFSNLIYKLKLFLEKQILPPIKYNGMYVKITDQNFDAIIQFKQSLSGKKAEELSQILSRYPSTATQEKQCSALDFINEIDANDTLSNKAPSLDGLIGQIEQVMNYANPDKQMIATIKEKIFSLKALTIRQDANLESLDKDTSTLVYPFLKELHDIIMQALKEIHEQYLRDAAQILANEVILNKAMTILKKVAEYKLENQFTIELNQAYEAYLAIKSGFKPKTTDKYAKSFSKCIDVYKSNQALLKLLECPEAQMIFDFAENDPSELKIKLEGLEQEKEELRMQQAEANRLLEETHALLAENQVELLKARAQIEAATSELLALKQSEKTDTSNSSFLVNLSDEIFNLKSLGVLSSATAMGLLISVFLPQLPLAIALGIATTAAVVATLCFFKPICCIEETEQATDALHL